MSKKSILITGCSSGIGYDAAHGLRKAGWRVFASCRKEEDCARLKEEGFESPRLDHADPASMESALAEVLDVTGGTLGALFNNGAFALPGALEDVPTDGLRDIYETNVFGWHHLTRAVIPVMRAQKHGRILVCSSVLGFIPARFRGPYVSSKYAVEGLTDVLRIEMARTPIEVIKIQPGPITSLIRQNAIPHFERWIDWENSVRVEQYRTALRKRLYESTGPDPFELPASAVTQVVNRALTAPKPRAAYRVTFPTHLMWAARRILPIRLMDTLCRKV